MLLYFSRHTLDIGLNVSYHLCNIISIFSHNSSYIIFSYLKNLWQYYKILLIFSQYLINIILFLLIFSNHSQTILQAFSHDTFLSHDIWISWHIYIILCTMHILANTSRNWFNIYILTIFCFYYFNMLSHHSFNILKKYFL